MVVVMAVAFLSILACFLVFVTVFLLVMAVVVKHLLQE